MAAVELIPSYIWQYFFFLVKTRTSRNGEVYTAYHEVRRTVGLLGLVNTWK